MREAARMVRKKERQASGEGPRQRPPLAKFAERAIVLGAKAARVAGTSTIATAPWVRLKCQYGCGGYGSSLCCPPHTPTPAQMREVLAAYHQAILFEAGKREPGRVAVKLERELFLAGYYRAFGLGAGPCRLCEAACAFAEGCRHPYEARPSMEACGIDVFQTARANGFQIEVVGDYDQPQHYFGLVLAE